MLCLLLRNLTVVLGSCQATFVRASSLRPVSG